MDVLSIVLGVSTALGSAGTIAYWRETHSAGARKKRQEEITAALSPVNADLQGIHAKLDADASHIANTIKIAIAEALEPLKDDIRTLSVKVEPMWMALEQLAIANAHVLHQPDPRRRRIDELLEKFDDRTLTPGEAAELRHYLTIIKNWEAGQDVGFPVVPGEPTAAAAVLATMSLVEMNGEGSSGDRT